MLAVDDEPEDFDEPEPVPREEDEDEDEDDDDEPEDLTPLDIEIDIGDDDDDEADEEESDEDAPEAPLDEDQLDEAPDDPNAHKRFWFEHATGAGKTVAAMGFVDASRTGGILILTHRRNLVDQFHGELKDARLARSASRRRCWKGKDSAAGPVTVETYEWLCATRARSPRPTRSSSATRRTPRSARRRAPRSAPGPARSSSA